MSSIVTDFFKYKAEKKIDSFISEENMMES